jgi:AcrR family transcriptional regulator
VTQLRSDAARNRAAILHAADTLFEQSSSPRAVSMDAIAAAAGVGKGTLFRRFEDRDALISAVVAERSRPLRQAIEAGPPPLGPRTPPAERILAVIDAIVAFKLETIALSLAHESVGMSPYAAPSYQDVHELITALLAELGRAEDPSFTAHLLLAATRADFILHLIQNEGRSGDDIQQRIRRATTALLDRP